MDLCYEYTLDLWAACLGLRRRLLALALPRLSAPIVCGKLLSIGSPPSTPPPLRLAACPASFVTKTVRSAPTGKTTAARSTEYRDEHLSAVPLYLFLYFYLQFKLQKSRKKYSEHIAMLRFSVKIQCTEDPHYDLSRAEAKSPKSAEEVVSHCARFGRTSLTLI